MYKLRQLTCVIVTKLDYNSLQGEVELENVPLRRDALRFFNASLDVRAGFVGRIRLKIPVARLRSEPWHILMENVYVVTGPQRFENFDPDQESGLDFPGLKYDCISIKQVHLAHSIMISWHG